jgi:hypothetical protein
VIAAALFELCPRNRWGRELLHAGTERSLQSTAKDLPPWLSYHLKPARGGSAPFRIPQP